MRPNHRGQKDALQIGKIQMVEKGSLSCSWGMQPTTEIIGIKFEVIQLIIFGTGILNLGNPKSEILYFLVMHFFLSWACSVRPSIGPFRLSQPLTSYLLQSHTQVICIFICLCTGSSTLNVCLDAVPLPQWSGWLIIYNWPSHRNQLGAIIMQWRKLQVGNNSREQRCSNFGASPN